MKGFSLFNKVSKLVGIYDPTLQRHAVTAVLPSGEKEFT